MLTWQSDNNRCCKQEFPLLHWICFFLCLFEGFGKMSLDYQFLCSSHNCLTNLQANVYPVEKKINIFVLNNGIL